MRTTWGFDYST